MSTTATLIEAGDRWLLPLSGHCVERLCIDHAVTMVFGGNIELRIEQPFVIEEDDKSEVLVIPDGDGERLGPVTRLARRVVSEAEAFKDGHLRIAFEDGSAVGVPTDEGFEAWQLVGPGGLRVVSLPGGDLVIWTAEPADGER